MTCDPASLDQKPLHFHPAVLLGLLAHRLVPAAADRLEALGVDAGVAGGGLLLSLVGTLLAELRGLQGHLALERGAALLAEGFALSVVDVAAEEDRGAWADLQQ